MSTTTRITTPATAAKVTFGPASLFKDTPQIATGIATASIYIAAVLNIILLSFPQIPVTLKTSVGMYSAEGVAFIHAICNMFGLNPATPPTTSTTTTAAMQTK
jgi:hypothetical protein